MFSKLWIINILFAAFAVFSGIKAYDIWYKKEMPKAEMPADAPKAENRSEKRMMSKTLPPESEYSIVAEKNLFSPERKEIIPEASEPEPEIKTDDPFAKRIVLYGVIMMDAYKAALVENPDRKPDERKDKWVKEGDILGEFQVAEIRKESILLADKDKKYEVLLYDKQKSGNKEKTAAKAPAANQPTVVVSESTAVKASGSGTSGGKAQDKSPSEPQFEMVDTPFGQMKRLIKPQPSPSENQAGAESEIDTPFGKMKQKN
ncbi:MAG: hypothetical protein BWK80_16785 [Desulfobacteraceae bacterium IS3]|nr:MAG: hypothetical protein BWK80_16785 [Desulfobacteraceae bacterium IS3]